MTKPRNEPMPFGELQDYLEEHLAVFSQGEITVRLECVKDSKGRLAVSLVEIAAAEQSAPAIRH